jgi:hypothetical protein
MARDDDDISIADRRLIGELNRALHECFERHAKLRKQKKKVAGAADTAKGEPPGSGEIAGGS